MFVMHTLTADASEYDDYFMEEWETVMSNFTPDLLVTVPVGSRSDEFFYEDVTIPGTLIRGAYFVIDSLHDSEKSGVDFMITDPVGEIIYERKDKVEGVFSITANKTGTYSLMIGNHKWMSSKQVTVLMGVGEQNSLKSTDLTSLTDGIAQIENTLKEVQSESAYLWIKQKSHMREVSSINSKVFWYHMLEFLVLVVVSSVQIYYIRGLLSSRRLF
jgi:p24 family protein beta-1